MKAKAAFTLSTKVLMTLITSVPAVIALTADLLIVLEVWITLSLRSFNLNIR